MKILLFVSFIIAFGVWPCLSEDGSDQFKACGVSYNCGELVDITYPFWGNERQQFCGRRELELKCKMNRTTTIEINSMEYKVLKINQSDHRMRMARADLFDSICQKSRDQIQNTSLDEQVLMYSWNNKKMSLWYNCSVEQEISESNRFWCGWELGEKEEGRGNYAIGAGFELELREGTTVSANNMEGWCELKLDVMVAMEDLNVEEGTENRTALVEKAVRRGMDVEYDKWYSIACDGCKEGGGNCGGNATYPFYCICASGVTTPFVCGPPPGMSSSSSKKKLIIGAIATGCIILIIFIIIFIYYTWKHFSNKDEIEEIIKKYSKQIPKRYSYSTLKKITDSFKNKLGQGGFSTVYKGSLPDGREVAVKLLNESKENGQDFMNEVISISRTSHINIATLLGFCYERNKRALVYEYMPKGSLEKYISQKGLHQNEVQLDWNTLYSIITGIAQGLEYLHRGCNTRILHFDIKPHNILLDNELCPKISDFGLAKQCRARESHVSMTGVKGTAGFMAPEVIFRNLGKVSHKSDVYSYGMLVLEMVGERKSSNEGMGQSSEEYFPDWIYKDLEGSEIDGGCRWGNTEEEEEKARKMIIVGLHCIQTLPGDRPSMTDVVGMLKRSVDGLQIPPKQALFGPLAPALPQASSSSSSSSASYL